MFQTPSDRIDGSSKSSLMMLESQVWLWTAEEIRWAKEVYGHATLQPLRRRFIEIQEELDREKDRERRRMLIEEERRLASASLSGLAGA